jgi:regulatory protein
LADNAQAHSEALKMLARRELSTASVRTRLRDRGFSPAEIDAAVARLHASGALDDGRVARAYARTAANVKGRGRLRVMRELQQMGIGGDVAAEALGEVFGDLDERAMIGRAMERKTRGSARPMDPREHARLYQFLMRQGFSPAGVTAALRRYRTGRSGHDDE